MPSQPKPLEDSRTERLLLLQLDSFGPESKVCLSLVDTPGGTLGPWTHLPHKASTHGYEELDGYWEAISCV